MDWTWLYVIAGAALNNLILLVWKPWTQAYAGEKGKNFARKEDLDKILAEVRVVGLFEICPSGSESEDSGEGSDDPWLRLRKRLRYAIIGLLCGNGYSAGFGRRSALPYGIPQSGHLPLWGRL